MHSPFWTNSAISGSIRERKLDSLTSPVSPRAIQGPNLRLWSRKWDFPESDPQQFASHWDRVVALSKELGLSRDARKRLEWFRWYYTDGKCNAAATCRHFGIARKLFYYWRRRFNETSLVSLEAKSNRPHRVRKSTLNSIQEQRIFDLRSQYLLYSKFKLQILYRERYQEEISAWKIEQVIRKYALYKNFRKAQRTAMKRRHAKKKSRISTLKRKQESGFLFCMDTIILNLHGGRRYVITAIDRYSRFAFARMYTTNSSLAATDFLRRLYRLAGGNITHVHTDNGSEFHRYFDDALTKYGVQHWWSRARTPKDNAVCERFNRTIQEEFIHCGNCHTEVALFNTKLGAWLIEYNFNRPHTALGYRRPIDFAGMNPHKLRILLQSQNQLLWD